MTKVRAPLFPLYSDVRRLLLILAGVPKTTVTSTIRSVQAQTGTPQNPVDWTEPDTWIPERLSGADAQFAMRIWQESQHTINPRHIYGAYLFINDHGLLTADASGIYRLTERGQAFFDDEESVVREIDDAEGLPQLLGILSTKTRAMRGDLVPEWGEFLREYSNYGTDSTIKDTLRRRLLNLIERGFVARDGNVYSITPRGSEYAVSVAPRIANPRRQVLDAIQSFNASQREQLRERLTQMHPYQFEHLVRDLLEAMGYEDVVVTQESGDRGVDVVATVQFGITTITEVVQVKRRQASIGRPILDQLRGALPYHRAIRGTLITLGTFSRGCTEAAIYHGAAPIGLIDGEKLLDLLIQHEIGIKKRPVQLYEIDEQRFEEPAAEDVAAEELLTANGAG